MATRQEILHAVRGFADAPTAPFVPGESYIPASGKQAPPAEVRRRRVGPDEIAACVDAALDGWLTAGRFAEQLERDLAKRVGSRWARLVNSGSSANLLAVLALAQPEHGDRRLRPGDEVLTVAAAFPTTVAPIIQAGAIPVFVDVRPDTANVNVDLLAEAITPKTRAIVLAHTLGNPFELDRVAALARDHDLWLVEDCCDALGARQAGVNVGTVGDVATLSCYPAHQITMGEGGAVLGQRPPMEKVVTSLRDWGRDCWCAPGVADTCGKRFEWEAGTLPAGYDHKYIYSRLGYNLKLTDMQAAIGGVQLARLDDFVAARRENHAALQAAFTARGWDAHFRLPQPTRDSEPSWFGYLLTVRDDSPLDRRAVTRYLEEHKVGTRLLFAGNVVRQPALEGATSRGDGSLAVTARGARLAAQSVGTNPAVGVRLDRRLASAGTRPRVVRRGVCPVWTRQTLQLTTRSAPRRLPRGAVGGDEPRGARAA